MSCEFVYLAADRVIYGAGALAHEAFGELRPGHNPRPVQSAQEILEILRSVW